MSKEGSIKGNDLVLETWKYFTSHSKDLFGYNCLEVKDIAATWYMVFLSEFLAFPEGSVCLFGESES